MSSVVAGRERERERERRVGEKGIKGERETECTRESAIHREIVSMHVREQKG